MAYFHPVWLEGQRKRLRARGLASNRHARWSGQRLADRY